MMPETFLHIADIHFWRVVYNPLKLLNKRFIGNLNVFLRRRHEYVLERAEPHADAVAAREPRFVLLTGDLTSTATDAEFRMARLFVDGLVRRGLKVAVLPGNHDVYTFRSHRSRRFERHFEPYIPSEGYPARVDLPGGTPLILVPTVKPNWFSSRGGIPAAVLGKIERLLADCGDQVVVAAHYPLLSRTPDYHTPWTHSLGGARALRALLGRSGKNILYVCGHVHRFSFLPDPRYPHVLYVSAAPFIGRGRQGRAEGEFNEIALDAEKTQITRHVNASLWHSEVFLLPHHTEP